METAGLKRMLGYLTYHSTKLHVKGEDQREKKRKATECLEKYAAMESREEKQGFLEQFEKGGGAKGKDSLKFCLDYAETLESKKVVRTKLTEHLVTRRAC